MRQLNAYSAVAYDFGGDTDCQAPEVRHIFRSRRILRPFAVKLAPAAQHGARHSLQCSPRRKQKPMSAITEHAVSVAALRAEVPPVRVQSNQAVYGANGTVKDVRSIPSIRRACVSEGNAFAVDNASLADVVSKRLMAFPAAHQAHSKVLLWLNAGSAARSPSPILLRRSHFLSKALELKQSKVVL